MSYHAGVNDQDHRLLAGGPAVRMLYATRVAAARYISTIATASGP